eukprot:3095938-Amphidinium_carterae.1
MRAWCESVGRETCMKRVNIDASPGTFWSFRSGRSRGEKGETHETSLPIGHFDLLNTIYLGSYPP